MTIVSCRLIIHGQVQGVGYRYSMAKAAQHLQLAGWVRNRLDATVEALIQGDRIRVEELIAWAWRGPRAAVVSRIEITEEVDGETHADFCQLPTSIGF